jgi:hypothetical protein
MECRVWRNGSELSVVVRLRPPSYLVPEDRYDVKPTYYVFGGLLFVPLTRNYLMTWTDPWWQNAPRDLVVTYEQGLRLPDYVEPVVLQKVLADRVNQGYHEYESLLVRKVQGEPIRSLRHLVRLVEGSDTPFVTFELVDGRQLVVDRALAVERHDAILARFGIPTHRSTDLVDSPTDPV